MRAMAICSKAMCLGALPRSPEHAWHAITCSQAEGPEEPAQEAPHQVRRGGGAAQGCRAGAGVRARVRVCACICLLIKRTCIAIACPRPKVPTLPRLRRRRPTAASARTGARPLASSRASPRAASCDEGLGREGRGCCAAGWSRRGCNHVAAAGAAVAVAAAGAAAAANISWCRPLELSVVDVCDCAHCPNTGARFASCCNRQCIANVGANARVRERRRSRGPCHMLACSREPARPQSSRG